VPRYFFHTSDGGKYEDDDGVELADDAAARTHAAAYAGQVLRSEPGVLWNGGDFRVAVTNALGTPVFTIVCSGTEGNQMGDKASESYQARADARRR